MPVFPLAGGLELDVNRGSGFYGSDNIVGKIRMAGIKRPGCLTAGRPIRPPFEVAIRNVTKTGRGRFTIIKGVEGSFDVDLDVAPGDVIEIVLTRPGFPPQAFTFAAV
jgi:hypothetical protein